MKNATISICSLVLLCLTGCTLSNNQSSSSPPASSSVQHQAVISWTGSTSTVAGYRVYRSTQSGGPYALLSGALIAETSYTDATVASGQIYYYVATSVDLVGVESAFSSEVEAGIPTP